MNKTPKQALDDKTTTTTTNNELIHKHEII